MAYTPITVYPGDIITSQWGNSIQTQYSEAKADIDAKKEIRTNMMSYDLFGGNAVKASTSVEGRAERWKPYEFAYDLIWTTYTNVTIIHELKEVDSDRAIWCYYDSSATQIKAAILSKSGDYNPMMSPSIVLASEAPTGGSTLNIVEVDSNKYVLSYVNSSGVGKYVVFTISDESISSIGTVSTIRSNMQYPIKACKLTTNKVIWCFGDTANSNYPSVIAGAISGTTITFGSTYSITGWAASGDYDIEQVRNNIALFIFKAGSYVLAYCIQANGTTLSQYGATGITVDSSNSFQNIELYPLLKGDSTSYIICMASSSTGLRVGVISVYSDGSISPAMNGHVAGSGYTYSELTFCRLGVWDGFISFKSSSGNTHTTVVTLRSTGLISSSDNDAYSPSLPGSKLIRLSNDYIGLFYVYTFALNLKTFRIGALGFIGFNPTNTYYSGTEAPITHGPRMVFDSARNVDIGKTAYISAYGTVTKYETFVKLGTAITSTEILKDLEIKLKPL